MNVTKTLQQICDLNNNGASLIVEGNSQQGYAKLQEALLMLKEMHKYSQSARKHAELIAKAPRRESFDTSTIKPHETKYRCCRRRSPSCAKYASPKATIATTKATTMTTASVTTPSIFPTDKVVTNKLKSQPCYTYDHAILLAIPDVTPTRTALELIHVVTVFTAVVLFNKALAIAGNEKDLPRCALIYKSTVSLLNTSIFQNKCLATSTVGAKLDLQSLLLVAWNNLAQIYYESCAYRHYFCCHRSAQGILSQIAKNILVTEKMHRQQEQQLNREKADTQLRSCVVMTGGRLAISLDVNELALNGKVGIPGTARAA